MNSLRLHPATMQLLRYQAAARWSRILLAFQGTRRRVLSILAVFLGLIWIGQAVLGLLFREAADPAKLRVWIPLGLLAYTVWHWLKIACRTPIEPFEWTPAERELLATAPLRRGDQVLYRLANIVTASAVKAACFALVMLPDLRVWPAGFVGMLLALLFVDLVRMALEVVAFGMSRTSFLWFRAATLAVAGLAGGVALLHALDSPSGQNTAVAIDLGRRFLGGLMELRLSWIGSVMELPFRVFGELILVARVSWRMVGFACLALGLVLAMIRFLLWLDRVCQQRRVSAERKQFAVLAATAAEQNSQAGIASANVRVPVPRAWSGAGSLAWRQMLGLFHYRATVLVSLIIPAVLSCLALATPQSGLAMMVQVVGGLVFYTFLLLPTALKFDFRRDIDRLGPIKALPISPLAVTLGELAVPIVVSTLFQIAVLIVAMIIRPYQPLWLLLSVLILLPANVLIVSFENLLFMLFPYRLNQEGVSIFLRSILTFTAKGLVFALALALALAWAVVSKSLGSAITGRDDWTAPALIFAAGMWLGTTTLAIMTTMLLERVFRRFDPSQDAPAIS